MVFKIVFGLNNIFGPVYINCLCHRTFVMPDYIQNTNVSDKSLGDIKTGLFQDAKKAVLKADSQPRPVLRIFYYASLKDKRPSFSGKDLKEDLKQIRKSIVANDLPNLGSSKDMPSPPLLFYYTIRLLYEEKLDFADNPEKDLLLTPEGFIIEMAGKLYLRKALIK